VKFRITYHAVYEVIGSIENEKQLIEIINFVQTNSTNEINGYKKILIIKYIIL